MTQPFEVTEDGKVRIAGAVIRDNAPFLWSAVISAGQNQRLLGFIYGRVQSVK